MEYVPQPAAGQYQVSFIQMLRRWPTPWALMRLMMGLPKFFTTSELIELVGQGSWSRQGEWKRWWERREVWREAGSIFIFPARCLEFLACAFIVRMFRRMYAWKYRRYVYAMRCDVFVCVCLCACVCQCVGVAWANARAATSAASIILFTLLLISQYLQRHYNSSLHNAQCIHSESVPV